MKLLINISEKDFERFKINQKKEYSESMIDVDVIANGIPIPDIETNGDALLSILKGKEDCIYTVGTNEMGIRIDCEWWNSPYQKGGK